MADYWKSTGKHYCEFCKCWTADNKVSIQFHEKGKNHQANVKKRLAEIKKNSIDKRKKDEQSKRMFEKMEKAALAAVQKDINSSDVTVGKSDMRNIVKAHAVPEGNIQNRDSSSTYPWQAMAGPQGTTYYYNSLTGESSWIMPEVFKKLKEKEARESETQASTHKEKTPIIGGKSYKLVSSAKVIHAKKLMYAVWMTSLDWQYLLRYESSTSVSKDPYRAKEKVKEVEKAEEIRDSHPLLGGWTTVQSHSYQREEKEEEDEKEEGKVVDKTTQETTDESISKDDTQQTIDTGKRFKERQLKTSIATSSDEPVAFKKRKFGNRNVRRRNDDD